MNRRMGFLMFTFFAVLVVAQDLIPNSSSSEHTPTGAYLYIYRSPSHIFYSSSAVFHQVIAGISDYLTRQHVVVVKVEEADSSALAGETPAGENVNIIPGGIASVPLLLERARAAGASHVLFLTVNRPPTSWVNLRMQCLDLSGNVLWQETASSSITTLTGHQGLSSALRHLTRRLDLRVGQPGLVLQSEKDKSPSQVAATNSVKESASQELTESVEKDADAAQSAGNTTSPAAQESAPAQEKTVVLPKGTSVRVVLATPVNSKITRAGDKVDFRVLEDVKVGDLVVISRKSAASGIVTEVSPPRRRHRPGTISIKIDAVSLVTHQVASLHGFWTVSSANVNSSIQTQAEALDLIQSTGGFGVFFLPLLSLEHGEYAVLPAGMELAAELDDAVAIDHDALVQAQPAPAEKRRGDPLVVVHHVSNPPTDRPKFYCGKVEVARLQHGTVFQFALPPGKYWFHLQDKKHGLFLTLEDGEEYYLRVDSVMTWGNPSNPGYSQFVRARPHDVGEIETAVASPLAPKYIKDLSKVDLALLQAAPK